MKKKSFAFIVCFVGFLVLLQPNSHAQGCQNPRDSFDDLYCLNRIYVQADADLNTIYKKLSQRLSTSVRQVLKRYQLAWIQQRNDTCSFSDSRGFYVNIRCASEMTVARTNFLNDRYRECISVGCLPNKLR